MRTSRWLLVAGVGLAGVAGLGACSDDGDEDGLQDILAESDSADWEVRPGVEIATLSGAEPDQMLTIYDEEGEALFTQPADEEGRAHFAYIPEGSSNGRTFDELVAEGNITGETLQPGEYVIRDDEASTPLATERFRVLGRDDVPDEALYDGQELAGAELGVLGDPVEGSELTDGFQYIEVRDGVQLSAMVRLPDQNLYGEGPWPTVVEISGYGPSNPDEEEPGSRLARTLGFATVSVNLRGTGCSGGVFDTFNPASMADGYDVVETVARQPWVLNNQVGMVGLSYSGITQLYTAATQPPSLAAVTAQSVIADPWLQQWPQGIYNDGFTTQWLEERERQAGAGSGWVQDRVEGGDETCQENIADHEMNIDFRAFARALEMRPPNAADRDLRELVRDIDTAVFLTGAFQDEQTGPQFGALLQNFDNAEALRARLWNGRHPDGYSTMNVVELFDFLELYVAERVPEFPDALTDLLAAEVASGFGFESGELDPAPGRLRNEFDDDYEAALASYQEEDPVQVVFGSGLGTDDVGAPGGVDVLSFASWPPPEAEASSWFFDDGGSLSSDQPDDGDETTFTFDPDAGQTTVLAGEYETTEAVHEFDWTEFPDGKSVSYETAPLDEDVVVLGPGYVDLWVGAAAADADVQVAVSEVRADGVEHLVQQGWLRLGHRADDEDKSTELEVVHPFTEEAYEPLPEDELVQARVALPSMGHVFSEGSTLRVTVSSPGRNHVTWTFEPPEGVDEDTAYTVGSGGETPSALVLPVADVGVEGVPEEIPCPGLRGIPCRE